jgi:UDP-N-acetylmuramyl pentapeptide phosphotransferase/UDP-N-acetylglucosamine-1-phosphate transferase
MTCLPSIFDPALALPASVWQGAPMNARTPQAGGFLLIVPILLGTFIGIWQGQSSIGFLAGTAVGILLAIGVYLRDRRRS